MTKILAIIGLSVLAILISVVSCAKPEWLSDSNSFLKGFVNQEMLSVLGVIVTITLASSANLHLELNRIEDKTGEHFPEARYANKAYAYLLIFLFFCALLLASTKPIIATNEKLQAAFNGAAIWMIILNILALLDLTSAVFAIPANRSL